MNTEHPKRPPTTTDAGIPVASQEHSLTVGPDGPILLQDFYLIEQMANFNRERIPERQPHAKGGRAFGIFVVTGDVSRYTEAAVFQPGTQTDLLLRFSTVAGERGSPDTWRDPRGFAVKFYTSDGNLDIVGNNAVLDHLPGQPHWMGSDQSIADRTTIVLHVDPHLPGEANALEGRVDHICEMTERVIPRCGVWHVGVSEARVVTCP